MKPQLAEDAVLEKIKYPCWQQPKVDGVRAMNLQGTLTGRSLDPFKGYGITDYFSQDIFLGFDGEMIVGDDPASPDRLCSVTTGAMGRFKGVSVMADLNWYVFDYIRPETLLLPYEGRYEALERRVRSLDHPRIHLMPYGVVHSQAELEKVIALHLEQGFEGTITRNPNALIKQGRSDKLQQLLRFKPWADFEMLVTGVTEGSRNDNEAKINSLGRTERSSAMAGLVPNGQIGSIQGTIVEDVVVNGKLLFAKGLPVTAGSGEMTVEEATAWFKDQSQIVGHLAKIKHMTHGVKDLPRFPTFQSKRLKEDMS